MLETLEIGARLAFDREPRKTWVVDRVQYLLDQPLFTEYKKGLPVLTESWLSDVFQDEKVSLDLQQKLRAWRIVAYAKGTDGDGTDGSAFVYYDEDDVLVLTVFQFWMALSERLTTEGVEDIDAIQLLESRGFIPFLPAGAYPQREEL